MNTRKKGWRTVNKGRKELSADGWLNASVEFPSKFLKNKDLFGLWDVIAIKPDRTKLIQFKTNRKPTLKKYKEFSDTYHQFECEIWIWYDRKGFLKITL